MWQSMEQAARTFLTLAALVSGVACQTHMVVGPGPAAGSHDAAARHGHHAAGSHTSGETDAEDPCCVPRMARTPSTVSVVSIAQTAAMAVVLDAPVALQRPDPVPTPKHKPPGRFLPLDQTSVLLI